MELFFEAAKKKYRFPSAQGDLTVEQLFDLPLTTTVKGKASLNDIAINLQKNLDAQGISFVDTPKTDVATRNRLQIVVAVIQHKQEEAKAAQERIRRAEEVSRIREILDRKEGKQLEEKSEEELRRRLAQLMGTQ